MVTRLTLRTFKHKKRKVSIMVKLTVNQRFCLIGMLDARKRIHDNIDPNWAIEVRK